MAKAMQPRKRYSSSDLKVLFGEDFRLPSDEVLESHARKPVDLAGILKSLKKQSASPGKRKNSTQELARVRRDLQKLLGRIEKIEKDLIAH